MIDSGLGFCLEVGGGIVGKGNLATLARLDMPWSEVVVCVSEKEN